MDLATKVTNEVSDDVCQADEAQALSGVWAA